MVPAIIGLLEEIVNGYVKVFRYLLEHIRWYVTLVLVVAEHSLRDIYLIRKTLLRQSTSLAEFAYSVWLFLHFLTPDYIIRAESKSFH